MPPVADQLSFCRQLSLERRRCERTEAYFALVLIDMSALTGTVSAASMDSIGGAIAGAMRETDVTGWYVRSSVMGVILTTLNANGKESLESVIVERIIAILAQHLDPPQLRTVQISCHIFPEDGMSNRIFYGNRQDLDTNRKPSELAKRAIDIMGSLMALTVLWPVFIVIAILIKATSRGPVFFKQNRVGRFGEEFTFLKFRSMVVNNDPAIHQKYVRDLIKNKNAGSDGTYKIKSDPRVTTVGRFLRKTSLDELPQFINVLRGEMSLVGPRPPIRYEFENYSLWHRRRILEVKPGITGEWQVRGRSRTTFDDMVRMDLHYIRNQSIWLDLKILAKTPLVVITGSGAY